MAAGAGRDVDDRGLEADLAAAAVLAVIAISGGIGLVRNSSIMPWRIPASLSLPILLGAAAALVIGMRLGFAVVSAVVGRVWSAQVAALLLASIVHAIGC